MPSLFPQMCPTILPTHTNCSVHRQLVTCTSVVGLLHNSFVTVGQGTQLQGSSLRWKLQSDKSVFWPTSQFRFPTIGWWNTIHISGIRLTGHCKGTVLHLCKTLHYAYRHNVVFWGRLPPGGPRLLWVSVQCGSNVVVRCRIVTFMQCGSMWQCAVW